MSFLRQGNSKNSGNDRQTEDVINSSVDEDDPEESSSIQVEDALTSFREKWQKELQVTSKTHQIDPTDKRQEHDFETEAKNLFLKGGEMERNGKLYEAIQFYRRAVQLVPDIEFRIDNINKSVHELKISLSTGNDDKDSSESEAEDNDEDDESDDENRGELLLRIQRKLANDSALCTPKTEQKTTHISALPMEMVLYILRWVVSAHLDFRSLEMFSMVCRGFYLCARDPEIWRMACLRVWGLNCGNSPYSYVSWRNMFIERPRLQFNGCYIGKTTYLRHGENSFQDQFYRPWHLVAYYRYLRFFPEGVVLVLTSADEPAQCVGQMKNKNARSPILRGYYKLKDDKVTVVVSRQDASVKQSNFKRPKRRGENIHDSAEQTFHMELQIKSTNKKRHVQLVWTHYSIYTRNLRGDESTCNFDLVTNRFPPFWFSRVKSYSSESESPLL